ncbi:MAG TPA: hypothetical protein VGH27_03875 [Streptosporangiaceae bacterium]|jgi:hypothetical protein
MRGQCHGLHCEGCRHGGAPAAAGIGSLVLLIGFLELAAHHRTLTRAAGEAVHVTLLVLAGTAVTVAAVALTIGCVWAARRRARQLAARPQTAVEPLRAWVLPAAAAQTERPAIEPGRAGLRVLPGWPGEAGAELDREDRR